METGTALTVLPDAEWQERRAAHERRVRMWTDPHQERSSRGVKHPTEDFLWHYYAFRPAWLRRWHPGPDVVLLGDTARDYLRWPEYTEADGGVRLDLTTFSAARLDSLAWMLSLLQGSAGRPPFTACYALHEWAMVYRLAPGEVRHNQLPLRYPPDELARIVESLPIRCSHFDAFRFFTPAARPLNRLQPAREVMPELEQPGCLHATMDLYKWAFKLAPFSPAELVADCFGLALAARRIDMRASPYDVRAEGLPPIAIETPEGRAEFEACQRDLAALSVPLRARLISLCERLLIDNPPAEPA